VLRLVDQQQRTAPGASVHPIHPTKSDNQPRPSMLGSKTSPTKDSKAIHSYSTSLTVRPPNLKIIATCPLTSSFPGPPSSLITQIPSQSRPPPPTRSPSLPKTGMHVSNSPGPVGHIIVLKDPAMQEQSPAKYQDSMPRQQAKSKLICQRNTGLRLIRVIQLPITRKNVPTPRGSGSI
jgi:hypothetical protein